MCGALGKQSLHCLSTSLKGQRREPCGNLGIKGSREVEWECVEGTLEGCLRFGSHPHVLLSAACPPPFGASWKAVGWLLWELMGAAGSERSRVLGIGPKILGEQGFPPSGFPAYCSWMNEVDFSLGIAFPTAPLWRPKESWGLLGRRTSQRAGQHKGSPGCPP